MIGESSQPITFDLSATAGGYRGVLASLEVVLKRPVRNFAVSFRRCSFVKIPCNRSSFVRFDESRAGRQCS